MKVILFLAATISISLMACNNGSQPGDTNNDTSSNTKKAVAATQRELMPQTPRPAWAPDIDLEMWAVLEKLKSYNAPPLETLSPTEARKQPTPTTAVMDLMKQNNIPTPPSRVDTSGKDIPVPGGSIHLRVYTPQTGDTSYPVIVYYHGGGWVIADLDVYDASARGLAEQTNAIVVSVHYRQGPENKFPTAHNDAFEAYQWVVKNAASIKGNPAKLAVAGESAGGNLACNVSILARDKKITQPLCQVLVYPVANNDMKTESYEKYGTAMPLSKSLIEWMIRNYLPTLASSADPRISLVTANLKGLPPTAIIAAEIDLLQSEGQLLTDKLKEADVKVDYKLYKGVTHEFFGMATVIPDAKDAQSFAVKSLKDAFNK